MSRVVKQPTHRRRESANHHFWPAKREDSHYAERADTPGSVTRQLAAQRALADRFPIPRGVLAQGESLMPQCSQHSPPFRGGRPRPDMRDQACGQIVKRGLGCWQFGFQDNNNKNGPEATTGATAGAGADSGAALPTFTPQMCFPGPHIWPVPWRHALRCPLRQEHAGHPCAPAEIPLDRQTNTLSTHSGCFQPLTGGSFLQLYICTCRNT